MTRFPIGIETAILAAAEKFSIPKGIALRLAWVESRGVPTAVSPAGARGLFQVMPDTGRAFGLTSEADFFNPTKSALVGMQVMSILKKRFGTWWQALAAYNRGSGWLRDNPDYHKWPKALIEYVTAIHETPGQGGGPDPLALKSRRLVAPGRVETVYESPSYSESLSLAERS